MEKGWKVEFRNVSSSYFPQSRVECHYSISSQHSWSSSDWIGLFKVGWSSLQNYHTFVWALAPANYQEASDVNCCVHFQACYLPGPGAEQYQFVYVDAKGEVVSQSSTFTFSAPKPLEELETLDEPVEVGEDLLLVVSRAEMLQGHLEECLKEREELFRTLTVANRSREHEREKADRVGKELQQKCDELLQDNHELRKQLRSNLQEAQRMKKEMESLAETLKVEKTVAQAEKVDAEMTIAQLEKDIKALNQRGLERETELERMKERARKAASQKKEEESECKNLKLKLEQTEKELHSLSTEFQSLRSSMAQRDTQVLQLRDTIANLTQKLNNAQKKEAASEAALAELQVIRERLEASERCVESLRSELREIGFQRDSVQGERHQARMQAAQLTLQLADVTMALGEGRASWAQERENLLQTVETERKRLDRLNDEIQQMEERLREERMKREIAELELGREKDCNRVQLSETRRELQELRTSLGVAQKEKEQLKTEKQEVIDHLQQLQQRLEALNVSKWSVTALLNSTSLDSSMSESEDENPEALQESHNPGALSRYGLCDQQGSERLLPATPPPSPRHHHASSLDHGVVISQPAPLNSPCQPGAEVLGHSSESEEEYDVPQSGGNSSGEETALLLLDHQDTALSELAESPLW